MSETGAVDSTVTNTVKIPGTLYGPVVQAGAINGPLHLHAVSPREPVRLPYRFGPVPARVAGFQARESAAGLAATLTEGDVGVVTGSASAVGVVAGLGGVGKTQLAADYAHHAWENKVVRLLVWITATGRDAVVAAYARLAADLTGAGDEDAEQGARRLLDWLAATEQPWLVVLDDVQAPADLAGLWPPRTREGRTLVTTRRRDAALARTGQMIEVGLFTPDESSTYLTTVLADRPHLAEGAADLAHAVAHLPLALSQAAAYLADRAITCTEYLARFHDQTRHLAELLPDDDALPDEHQATVTATVLLSVEAADRFTPRNLARPLLRLCALLDPNGIPLPVLTTEAVLDHLSTVTGRQISPELAHDGLACLHRLHLIDLVPTNPHQGIRVHALVQRATRDHTPEHDHGTLTRIAADALVAAWPDIERDATLAEALRANTFTLHQHTGKHLWRPDVHRVLFRAGVSLAQAGRLTTARDHYTHLHTTAVALLGADHPDTLTTRHNVAHFHGRLGDPAGAAAALGELLDDMVRIMGPDHFGTLATRNDLAHWQGKAGDMAGAVSALGELLDDMVRIMGPDHPRILVARHTLAHWQGKTGDMAGAVSALGKLLDDRLRVLGPDHPDTLIIRHDLARWRGEAGDTAGAVAAFSELLDDRLRMLSPDHPDTLATRHNLAHWRGKAGDPAGAVAAAAELLIDRLRVLGPDHPDTLATRNNLAHWRQVSGRQDADETQ